MYLKQDQSVRTNMVCSIRTSPPKYFYQEI